VNCRLVGYQEESFSLMPSSAFPIAPGGVRIAELRKSTFGRIICRAAPGATVNGRPLVHVANGSRLDIAAGDTSYGYRLEVLAGRRASRPREEPTTQSGGFY
jgi:hypothetical protein